MYHSLIKPCIFRAKWDILMRSNGIIPFCPRQDTCLMTNGSFQYVISLLKVHRTLNYLMFTVVHAMPFWFFIFHFSLKNKIKCYFLWQYACFCRSLNLTSSSLSYRKMWDLWITYIYRNSNYRYNQCTWYMYLFHQITSKAAITKSGKSWKRVR